jgi:hypothetical protein
MIDRTSEPLALVCDRCGERWTKGASATELRDNAKALRWTQKRRFGAVRDYCFGCSSAIEEREHARKRK